MKRIEPLMASLTAPGWPRPQLEIRHLELVLALAAAGTTAGAAASLHISQSAISRALSQAEERVGAPLFERSARGVAPSPAGERLIAGARLLLAQLSELERQVAAPETPPTRLRLVCECYTAYRWLPSTLAQLRQHLPGLELDIATAHTDDPVAALLADQIDIALLTTARLPAASRGPGALLERPLFTDEIVFVVGAGHALARVRSITPEDLCRHPLITANTPPAEARWFQRSVFNRRKPKLELIHFPLTEGIMDAARAGMGIAVLSEWMASGYLGQGDLVQKRLSSGPLRRPWRIAYRREATPTAERLRHALIHGAPRSKAFGALRS